MWRMSRRQERRRPALGTQFDPLGILRVWPPRSPLSLSASGPGSRNHPGVLGQLATAIGAAGGSLVGIEIVATDGATVTRDVVVFCGSEGHAAAVEAAARGVEGIEILEVEDRTFAMHEAGKLTIDGKRPLRDRDDLAMAYTPGVARVCLAIADQPALVHRYTMKANTVAVVTDGTAVLGLGDIGPEAALPGHGR